MPFLNVFPILAHPQNKFAFIMKLICKFRIIKWSMRLKQRALGFHKNYRFIRYFITKFCSMIGIVPSNTNYLHSTFIVSGIMVNQGTKINKKG